MARPKNDDGIDSLGVTAANYAADDIAAALALADRPLGIRPLCRAVKRPERRVREILAVNKDRFVWTDRGIAVRRYKP